MVLNLENNGKNTGFVGKGLMYFKTALSDMPINDMIRWR